MIRRIVFAITMIVVSLSPVRAQQALSIDEAVKIALENNRDLKMAEFDQKKADYQVREAYGLAMPNISASADYARALKKSVFFMPATFSDPNATGVIPVEIGSNHSLTMAVQATQTLFNAAVITGVGTAKIYQKAAGKMYEATVQSTIADTKRAFYQVLYMKDVLALTKASFENAQQNLKNVQILNAEGLVSDYDLIRAEVQAENIRPMVTQAENNVVLTENALKISMGLSPEEDVTAAGTLEFDPVDNAIVTQADDLLLEKNATLKALEFQKQVNDELITVYRSEYLPTLAAYGNYTWQSQQEELRGFSTGNLIGSSSVGLSLSLNLFNGWQTTSKVAEAKMDSWKSEETYKQSRDAMLVQVQNVRSSLDEARKRIEAQKRTVSQAQKGYDIASANYKAGSGTQLEVNDADVALMQARVNKAQAVYDYNIAKVNLEELLNIQQ